MQCSTRRLLCNLVFWCLSAAFVSAQSISPTAFPTATVADGHSTLTIKARILNSNGVPVADGTQVVFETDLGSFRDGGDVTTKDGVASVTLVAGTTPGMATITVRAFGQAIAPGTVAVEFAKDREQLNLARDFAEIVSQKALQFSPSDRRIQAEDLDHHVRVQYKGVQIEAEKIDLNLETYELKAYKAKVRINQKDREYSRLDLHLDSLSGYGLTTVKEDEITGIASVGKVIVFQSAPSVHYGIAAIKGANVRALHLVNMDNFFKINDFEDPPALITARKAVVYRNKEVQFQQAELYAGDSRVLRLPLYRAPLTGDRRLFTEQILNVNDNQIAVTYPYYLTLKPGETSFLRFHMGDSNGFFGNSNRPQLDYEIDWDRGAENYGGFVLGGLGQDAWGIDLHQYYRFDSRTTGFAQMESPATRSLNGSMSLTHDFLHGYSGNFNSSITQSLIGDPLTDQSASLLLQRDPMKVGNWPLRFSYGATASLDSTTAPIAIKKQEAYGIQGQLTMLQQKLAPDTRLDGSLTASHLMGSNVNPGLTFGGNLFLRTRLQNVNYGFGYTYTQDPLQSLRVGQHLLSGLATYDRGNTTFSLHGSTSLDISNVEYSSSVRYRFKKLWSMAYTSSFYRYLGGSFLDYNFGVFYTYFGAKQVGLIWSYRTNRLGIQLYGD